MDGGDAEKKVAEDIKQTVKATARRKRPHQGPHVMGALKQVAAKLAPKEPPAPPRYVHETTPPRTDDSPSSSGAPPSRYTGPLDPHDEFRPANKDLRDAISDHNPPAPAVSAEESFLLMYFIDNVFPLQYPMYEAGNTHEGRGWLLSLLLNTKPLFHAALALGAYHRWLVIFATPHPGCRILANIRQEEHMKTCLEEAHRAMRRVNRFVEDNRLDIGIGIVASVCQLVFFEVSFAKAYSTLYQLTSLSTDALLLLKLFTCNGGSWRIHLKGATDIYRLACADDLTHLGLQEKSRAILRDQVQLTLEPAVVRNEVYTMRFMSASLIWLDIIASITSGSSPKLQPYHTALLSPESKTKLEDVVSCRDWALVQLGRIADLHARNEGARRAGHISCSVLVQEVEDLRQDTDSGLCREGLDDYCGTVTTTRMFDLRKGRHSEHVTLITRMFGYAALIYLHLVMHGFQKLDDIEGPVSRAIWLLRNRLSDTPQLIPALVCPLYLIGIVARTEPERDLFRDVFQSTSFLEPLFKHLHARGWIHLE
jgi:hypothetical protein